MELLAPKPVEKQTDKPATNERSRVQQLTGLVALVALLAMAVAFYFLPGGKINATSLVLAIAAGGLFFTLYSLLPQVYFNETFLIASDALYIILITFMATQVGQYGVIILFLYFIIIFADAHKYAPTEYTILVVFILQAVFLYILLWSPFPVQTRIGTILLSLVAITSTGFASWHFAHQNIDEHSMRFVLERKAKYLHALMSIGRAASDIHRSVIDLNFEQDLTPMTIIKNALAELRTEKLGVLVPKQLDYLMSVATSYSEDVISLIRNLQTIARLESGELLMPSAAVELSTMLEELAKQYRPLFEDQGIRFQLEIPAEPIKINVSQHYFQTAIGNLLENAFRYTEEGLVIVRAKLTDQELTISVGDTGFGLNEETKRNLFTKFYRSDEAVVARPEGYGVGLSYAQLVVKLHGGQVSVDSVEGKGSVFTIHLPKSIVIVTESKEGLHGN